MIRVNYILLANYDISISCRIQPIQNISSTHSSPQTFIITRDFTKFPSMFLMLMLIHFLSATLILRLITFKIEISSSVFDNAG
jgi:hypothetical protein